MTLSRRTFLTTSALATLGWTLRPKSSLAALALTSPKTQKSDHVLITIFLRGGVDALNTIVPYADDHYHRARPTIGIGTTALGNSSAIDLDGYFGLHPSLQPLLPLFQNKQLAIVHACGSDDTTLSHFDAMATMERGLNRDPNSGISSGWLARHLNLMVEPSPSPLRAIAISETAPQSLAGAMNASAFQSIDDMRLGLKDSPNDQVIKNAVRHLYADQASKPIGEAGMQSLEVLRRLEGLSSASYKPTLGVFYSQDDLGNGLRQVAMLMKVGVGLEVACLDHGGYDTHVAQGGAVGLLGSRLDSLAKGIAAFQADLGDELWQKTTIVVQSEFGRRVEENGGLGTDHGRGGMMMVLGGSDINGGKVYGNWPGLAPEKLDTNGNLKVTTDYRNILAEVLANRCNNDNPQLVFPGLNFRPIGVTQLAA